MADIHGRAYSGRLRREGKLPPQEDGLEKLLEDASDAFHSVIVDIENGKRDISALKAIIAACKK